MMMQATETVMTQPAMPAGMGDDDVLVTAPGKPFRIEVEQIRRGQAAFAKDHDRYAPHATLHFRLSARNGGALDGFALSATDGHASVPVPLAADGDIQLPALPAGNWTLIGNRSRTGIRLRVLVLSPGSVEADRRLGDLRLQCRVGWAVIRSEVSFFLRSAADAAGVCSNSHIAIYEGIGRPIASAAAWRGTTPILLKISQKLTSYQMPLADRSLDDEARVRITFR